MRLTLCLGSIGLLVYGYARLHAVGGWPLVFSTLALFVSARVLGMAAERIQG